MVVSHHRRCRRRRRGSTCCRRRVERAVVVVNQAVAVVVDAVAFFGGSGVDRAAAVVAVGAVGDVPTAGCTPRGARRVAVGVGVTISEVRAARGCIDRAVIVVDQAVAVVDTVAPRWRPDSPRRWCRHSHWCRRRSHWREARLDGGARITVGVGVGVAVVCCRRRVERLSSSSTRPSQSSSMLLHFGGGGVDHRRPSSQSVLSVTYPTAGCTPRCSTRRRRYRVTVR